MIVFRLTGMEMPKSCGGCEVPMDLCDKWKTRNWGAPRPQDCPLVEIPAHGRLIDEQWLKDEMITTLEALKKNPKMDRQEMHLIAAFDTLRAMVEDAPTIITAEEN